MENSKDLEQPLVPKQKDEAPKVSEEEIEKLRQSTYLNISWLALMSFSWVTKIVNVNILLDISLSYNPTTDRSKDAIPAKYARKTQSYR